jgi:cytidine deaminase
MSELKHSEIEKLVHKAIEVRDQAYAPHSHFYVGASILVDAGDIFVGCNVENASYSLCQCAERNAASAAVAAGHRDLRAIAITSIGGVTPCGACRQFLAEFNINMTVILVDVINGSQKIRKLAQLLPDAFDASSLQTHP